MTPNHFGQLVNRLLDPNKPFDISDGTITVSKEKIKHNPIVIQPDRDKIAQSKITMHHAIAPYKAALLFGSV